MSAGREKPGGQRGGCKAAGLLLLSMWLSGCASLSAVLPWSANAYEPLAGTYVGDLACAGCPSRQLTLTLLPDQRFRAREQFGAAPGQTLHDLGTWRQRRGQLILQGGALSPRRFRVLSADELQWLTPEGRPWRGLKPYRMTRQPVTDPIAEPMRLMGLYRVRDGAARFQECLTGQTYPVSDVGFGEELRRQHGAQQRALGRAAEQPVLVTLTAGLPATETAMTVALLDRFWPAHRCPRAGLAPVVPLAQTRWQLVVLDGQALRMGAMHKPAHLQWVGDRLTGSDACNSLQGRVVQTGQQLRFSQLRTTRMACHGEAAQIAARLAELMAAPVQIEQRGETLLWVQAERVLARFQAQHEH